MAVKRVTADAEEVVTKVDRSCGKPEFRLPELLQTLSISLGGAGVGTVVGAWVDSLVGAWGGAWVGVCVGAWSGLTLVGGGGTGPWLDTGDKR